MELQQFIKESLVQIAKGVSDANEEVRKVGGVANPMSITVLQENKTDYGAWVPHRNLAPRVVTVKRIVRAGCG